MSPGGAGGNRAPLLGIAGFLPFVIASPSAEGRGNLRLLTFLIKMRGTKRGYEDTQAM